MENLRNLAEARVFVKKLVAKQPAAYGWVADLPEQSLDQEARIAMTTAVRPNDLVEKCNPFAVRDIVNELSALYDLLSRLRTDAHATEAALIREVLSDEYASGTLEDRQKLVNLSVTADWNEAKQSGAVDLSSVEALVKSEVSERERRRLFRATQGHPFNLQEKTLDLRRRYIEYLRRFLAKSEAVRLVLKRSFNHHIESLISLVSGTDDNPLPRFGDWLRSLTLDLEDQSNRETVVTLYRLIGSDGWISGGGNAIQSILSQDGDTSEIKIDFSAKNLGLQDSETARLLAIGIAPTVGYYKIEVSHDDFANLTGIARNNLPFMNYVRSLRTQISFDARITFDSVTLRDEVGSQYTYPEFTEFFGGIGAWGVADGPASSVVSVRSPDRLVNRPVGNSARLVIAENVRTNWGTMKRKDVPYYLAEQEMTLKDVLICVRFVKARGI